MVWALPGLPTLTSVWDSISKGIHTGIAGIADETDFDGDVGEVDGSVDFDAALTGGVQILEKNVTIRGHKSFKRTELNRFHHTKRIINIMFRRSAIHKSWMVPTGLLISSVIPACVMHIGWPLFVLLGTHMGVKASKDVAKLFHKLRDKHTSPGAHQDHKLKRIVHENSNEDLLINAEIMGTLWELTRNDTFGAKTMVMGVYGAGMPLMVYAATRILLSAEHYGYVLKSWGEDGLDKKRNNNLPLGWSRGYYAPVTLGKGLNKVAHSIFVALPWAGVVAKFITSGRTIAHAAPRISQVTAQMAESVGHTFPLISSEATAISWSFTSAAAVLCARTAYQISHEPIRKIIDKSPHLVAWKTSGKALITRTSGSDTAQLLRQTADNPLLMGRLLTHVGKKIRKPAFLESRL